MDPKASATNAIPVDAGRETSIGVQRRVYGLKCCILPRPAFSFQGLREFRCYGLLLMHIARRPTDKRATLRIAVDFREYSPLGTRVPKSFRVDIAADNGRNLSMERFVATRYLLEDASG